MAPDAPAQWAEPTTIEQLHLPPTFVADHALRTLSYQGPQSPSDMARHWRVSDAIVVEALDALKSAGLVQLDAGQATFERLGRVRLTEAGAARVPAARTRTWYAGALPVAMREFDDRSRAGEPPRAAPATLRSAVEPFSLEAPEADALGQAISASAIITLAGAAPDEQTELVRAIGDTLAGDAALPYAAYAAGAIVRLFDPRYHVPRSDRRSAPDAALLRAHSQESRWVTVAPPVVVLAGGVLPSDALPAYDDEARFYVAPAPFAAGGGLLAVRDGGANPDAVADLARLWLIPGRQGVGIILLRTGERIEVPWRAATIVFDDGIPLPAVARDVADYRLDITDLTDAGVSRFVGNRLSGDAFVDDTAETVARAVLHAGVRARTHVAAACRYLRDRARYEGNAFTLSDSALSSALDHAATERPAARRLSAA